ncbi:hypothetical protein BDW59DRAFT_142516 [Aspergillus cavernicola]|uniref:Mid2 domain-containing protein n=1 Tax=Aspergillus cavernicola TaxID=176166 RepID=A0ABR4IMC9_9EURO
MHTSWILQSAISILTLLSRFQLSDATPLGLADLEENGLEKRAGCDNPCGYYSQLCCASGETCTTDDNSQAVCSSSGSGSGSGSGSWEYYSSTYLVTETDVQTLTSTWSSWVSTPTSSSCEASNGETECGSDCCGAAYVCSDDQCVLAATTSIWATNTASPPVRPTDSNTVTETATATQGFEMPVNTDGSPAVGVDAPDDDGGLSGGAIAGIVVGTIAGVFLLFLLCLCLCARGILHSILACLGIGRRRREETYIEDHHSHHTHGAAPGRTWFGTRPSAPAVEGEKKSRWGSLATIGIIIGALALCLGLRRKKDQDEKSDYTYPSYYSYYTSTTSESSDRRTRRSRRSGRSRSRTHS